MTTIAITGTSGYVGGTIASGLEARGLSVIRLGRHAADRHFSLTATPAGNLLDGADALIHCAWDVNARGDAHRANVVGSIALLDLARHRPAIFISSMAAFDGCRSEHGRTKVEVERAAAARGAVSIRPGMLYSKESRGLFRTLATLIQRARLLPLVGGAVRMPLLHIDDLTELVARLIESPGEPRVISAAYPERIAFGTILRVLAAYLNRGTMFVPVPATAVMAALRLMEICGLAPRTGSDNLLSLLHPNPRPDLPPELAGVRFRPFNTVTLAQ